MKLVEVDRLHMTAAQSLKSRAHMADSLCALAEAQIEAGRLVLALGTLREMRSVVAAINTLVDGDTSYLSHGTLEEIRALLARINERAVAMDARLGPDPF
jgi:hypothetical protein